MIAPIALINAMVATFQKIPTLTQLLANGPDSVYGYIDLTPTMNSTTKARYQQPAGSVMVVYHGFAMSGQTTMEQWRHSVAIYLKSVKGDSDLALIEEFMNGVANQDEGLRWRYCPVTDGVLPTQVLACNRITDQEGIDYFVVVTATQETGDF